MREPTIKTELNRMLDKVRYELLYLEQREADWKASAEDAARLDGAGSIEHVRCSAKYYTFSASACTMRGIVADVESLIETGELSR